MDDLLDSIRRIIAEETPRKAPIRPAPLLPGRPARTHRGRDGDGLAQAVQRSLAEALSFDLERADIGGSGTPSIEANAPATGAGLDSTAASPIRRSAIRTAVGRRDSAEASGVATRSSAAPDTADDAKACADATRSGGDADKANDANGQAALVTDEPANPAMDPGLPAAAAPRIAPSGALRDGGAVVRGALSRVASSAGLGAAPTPASSSELAPGEPRQAQPSTAGSGPQDGTATRRPTSHRQGQKTATVAAAWTARPPSNPEAVVRTPSVPRRTDGGTNRNAPETGSEVVAQRSRTPGDPEAAVRAPAVPRRTDGGPTNRNTPEAASDVVVRLSRTPPSVASRMLEDVVTELVRPMVREWLDANLAGIVEHQVRRDMEHVHHDG